MRGKNRLVDMTQGPLVPNLVRFAFPLLLAGLLQLTFNAADVIVVGRCVGDTALAAVTSSSPLINMLLGIFLGLSMGGNVVVARTLGREDRDGTERAVHTCIATGIWCGLLISALGLIFSPLLLRLMDVPDTVMGEAVLYLRIYFLGTPASVVFNFGAAVLRGNGDSRRPMWFLILSGAVNLALNLLFVIGFDWGVAGVAVATSVSNILSCVLVLRCLTHESGPLQLCWKQLRLDGPTLGSIVLIGIPGSIQATLVGLSNVVIQSAVNSFGDVFMAGSGASGNIEGFVWTAMNAVYQACLTFTSRNLGAGKHRRVTGTLWHCIWLVVVVGLGLGGIACLFGRELLGLYTRSPQALACGMERMLLVCLPYFILGISDVLMGSMRGMGQSVVPMINAITFMVGFRILWVNTVVRIYHIPVVLFAGFPLSWCALVLANFACWLFVRHRVFRQAEQSLRG